MASCAGSPKAWAQIDAELHAAGWGGVNGVYTHDQAEVAAYESAAKCTPVIIGFNDKAGGLPSLTGGAGGIVPWLEANTIPLAVGAIVGILVARLK